VIDHHVDRPQVYAQQCAQPSGPNRPSGSITGGRLPARRCQEQAADPSCAAAMASFGPVFWPAQATPRTHDRGHRPPIGGWHQNRDPPTRLRPAMVWAGWWVGWTTWWLWRGEPTRSHPELGRENPQRPWYCVSRRGRVGRRQVLQPTHTKPPRDPHPRESLPHNAGWSSPVARQAHNLKVRGSNPLPATNDSCESKAPKTPASERTAGFFLFAANRRIAARSPRSTMASSASAGTSVT
jgi:hypothetical protein